MLSFSSLKYLNENELKEPPQIKSFVGAIFLRQSKGEGKTSREMLKS